MNEVIQNFMATVGLDVPPETFAELVPYAMKFIVAAFLVLGVFWVVISIGKSFAYALRKF